MPYNNSMTFAFEGKNGKKSPFYPFYLVTTKWLQKWVPEVSEVVHELHTRRFQVHELRFGSYELVSMSTHLLAKITSVSFYSTQFLLNTQREFVRIYKAPENFLFSFHCISHSETSIQFRRLWGPIHTKRKWIRSQNNQKRSKNKWQTSKNIFAFAFAFACVWTRLQI